MSLELQQEKLTSLMSATPEIPGLNAETAASTLVEAKYKKLLDAASTPEEREAIKSKMVEYYKNEGKEYIDDKIAELKTAVGQLTQGISQVPVIISGIAATIAVPTSAAAAVPMIASLISFIDGLKVSCVNLLKSANALGFELPEPIFGLIAAVEALYSLIPQ